MVLTSTAMANQVDEETHWLHPDDQLLSHQGVRYEVTYLGSVEVLCSMKTLDFESRTRVARDSIRLVCSAAGLTLKERQKSNEMSTSPSMIAGQANLTHNGIRAELIINTEALTLKRVHGSQVLCSHRMEGISFASAGEHETKDYIAYVAKDNLNKRACHVLLCQDSESLDVITTIGQAFELRYNEYIKSQQQQSNPANEERQSLEQTETPSARNSSDISQEKWFHGKLSREEAEVLLSYDGDFLVRESTKIPGQFILSGRTKTQYKHLLLVDPDGVVRTKDYEFDSIQHLIAYHRTGNIPIVSADSELHLQTPILRRK